MKTKDHDFMKINAIFDKKWPAADYNLKPLDFLYKCSYQLVRPSKYVLILV